MIPWKPPRRCDFTDHRRRRWESRDQLYRIEEIRSDLAGMPRVFLFLAEIWGGKHSVVSRHRVKRAAFRAAEKFSRKETSKC